VPCGIASITARRANRAAGDTENRDKFGASDEPAVSRWPGLTACWQIWGNGDMSGPIKRVLIADDHDVIRRGVARIARDASQLPARGRCRQRSRGAAAARETKPDIAILDYSLPELNGYELTVALKREFPHSRS
jgi:hypothetical protein